MTVSFHALINSYHFVYRMILMPNIKGPTTVISYIMICVFCKEHVRLSVIMILFITVSHPCGYCKSCCTPVSVVLNEIMYSPQNGEPEWIEVYNRGTVAIDFKGWTIEDADSTRPRTLTDSTMLIESDSYVCITQDPPTFLTLFPHVSCPVLQPLNGWPRLNNTGDRIVLRDSTGTSIDALEYDDEWGGGEGRSLERINPDWPSNNSAKWSACVSPSGSTPCDQNSIFTSFLQGMARITVTPDPFDTETTISYRLTVPTALVKLEIFDIRGHLVRTLLDQVPSGSTGSVIWNGTDVKGQKLRMGLYILYLEAINAEMGVLDRVKKSVTLAQKLK